MIFVKDGDQTYPVDERTLLLAILSALPQAARQAALETALAQQPRMPTPSVQLSRITRPTDALTNPSGPRGAP